MLKMNGRSLFSSPGRFYGPAQTNQMGEWQKAGSFRNRSVGGFSGVFDAYPNGGLAPNAYYLPRQSGSISSYREASGAITVTVSNLVQARPMLASASLQLTVSNAQLDQIVSAVANGTLSLAVAQAILAGGAQMAASGSCTLTVDSAVCGAIFSVLASGNGQITPAVTLTARASMEAEAGGPEALSPQGLARAVWNEPMDDYNDVGTFGEQLKNLSGGGGGGGPSAAAIADAVWDEAINAHLTSGSAGKFINDLSVELEKRLKTTVFLGNK